jgi:hypothetical protein
MSYDIFLACVRGDDTVRFKREVFEEIFLPHCPRLKLYQDDPGFMQVEYDDGGRADIDIMNTSDKEKRARKEARTPERRLALPSFPPGDPAYIECLGFSHFGGDAFFRDLYDLADLIGAAIFAGSMEIVVIATKAGVLGEIHRDYIGMDGARVVRNPAELEEALFNS